MKHVSLLIFMAALASISNAAPIAGLNDSESAVIVLQNTPGEKLAAASLAYDKLGYLTGLVELAKDDAEAAKKLGEIEKKLKDMADFGDNYSRAKLAELYYLKKDFENFEKYASADISAAIEKVSTVYNVIMECPAVIGSLSSNRNAMQNILNSAFYSVMNSGDTASAKKILDAYKKMGKVSWNSVYMYLRLYEKDPSKEMKKEILSLSEADLGRGSFDINALRFVISDGDPEFKVEHDKAEDELAKMTETQRLRKLYDIYRQVDRNKKGAEILERLYDLNALKGYEMADLARYYMFGKSNYWRDSIPAEFKDSPSRDKAIKLLEEAYERDENNKSYVSALLVKIYSTLGNGEKVSEWIAKAEADGDTDSWGSIDLAVSIYLGKDGMPKDEKRAEAMAAKLGGERLGEFYVRLANEYRSGKFADTAKAIELSKKAIENKARNTYLINRYFDMAGYGELDALAAQMPDNGYLVNLQGMRSAKNGDWGKAFESFKKAFDLGYKNAAAMMFGCYLTGRGVEKDEGKAMAMLQMILNETSNNSYGDDGYDYYDMRSGIYSAFGDRSDVYLKLLQGFNSKPTLKARSVKELLGLYRDSVDENKKAEIAGAITEIEALPEGSEKDSMMVGVYTNSDGPVDYAKAAEYAKKIYNAKRYDSLSYVFMVLRGIGVEKDAAEAFRLLSESNLPEYYAYKQNAWLAYFYENGIGVEKNAEKAAELRAKVERDSVRWMFNDRFAPQVKGEILRYVDENTDDIAKIGELYQMFMFGASGLPKDHTKALGYLEKIYKNSPEAAYEMANFYKNSWKYRDAEKHFKYLKEFEALGLPESSRRMNDVMYMLGCAYMNGIGTEQNGELALEYFKKASADPLLGNAFKAMEGIARCVEKGIGCEADPDGAMKMRDEMKRIAKETNTRDLVWPVVDAYASDVFFELGSDAKARKGWIDWYVSVRPDMRGIGSLCDYYSVIPQNRDWRKASEYADEHAKYWGDSMWSQHRIGVYNVFGIGRDKDVEKGIALLEKSAEKFNPYAIEMLAYIYGSGAGVEKDAAKEAEWLEKLSELAYPPYSHIAARYIRASDSVEDPERAKFVLKLGADAGDEEAKNNLENFGAFVNRCLDGKSAI